MVLGEYVSFGDFRGFRCFLPVGAKTPLSFLTGNFDFTNIIISIA